MVFAPAPSTVLLVLSALIVIAGFVALAIVEQRTAPPRPCVYSSSESARLPKT